MSAAQDSAGDQNRGDRDAVEACRPGEALAYGGYKGFTAEQREAAEAAYYSAASRRSAAKAAKAVARSTDRLSTIAEEMGQSVQWTYDAESMAHRGSAVRQLSIERSDLLRCVWGNPFRSSEIAAACLTRDVIGLAERIYHEREFNRLPVLADMLEGAGCAQADVLAHCRCRGPHGRGCWVLDLVLAG